MNKKMLKMLAITGVLIVTSIFIPLQAQTASANSHDFKDVPKTHPFYKEINTMRDEGIIKGYTDNTFKPTQPISRVHVASLFVRSLDLKPIREGKEFKDVPKSSMYYNDVQTVYRAGIFDGNTNGTFGANDNLTRAQMAKVLVKAFNLKMQKGYIFNDIDSNHWAKDYIATLYTNGITVGSNGKYLPNDSVTRAHYSAFLYRALHPEDAPKPVKPLQPKPPVVKPEPKPQPKPEPKPNNNAQVDEWGNPKLGNPSGRLPSGASKYDDKISAHFYNYSKSLPGGGSIQEVSVHSTPELIMMTGKDIDGKNFIASYYLSDGLARYNLVKPNLSNSASSTFYEVGRSFAKAYGME